LINWKLYILLIDFGPALIEHVLLEFGFPSNSRIGPQFDIDRDLPKLHLALKSADDIMQNIGNIAKVTFGYNKFNYI
jgi:hypothetical protein